MTELRQLMLILSAVPFVHAQQNTPHVGYVYPAGGQQGATVEVRVGGQFLISVNSALVSGSGVQASVVKCVRPMNQESFHKLRNDYAALRQKQHDAGRHGAAAWTNEDEKKLADLKDKMDSAVVKPVTPAISEIVTLRIALAPDAAPGERELRLSTFHGLVRRRRGNRAPPLYPPCLPSPNSCIL